MGFRSDPPMSRPSKPKKIAEEFKSSRELAHIFGADESRVRQLTKEGILEGINQPGKVRTVYPLAASVQAWCDYRVSVVSKNSPGAIELERERMLKLRADRMYRENALAEQRGELHRATLIKALYGDRVRSTREALLGVPNKLADQLACEVEVSAVHKILTREMIEVASKLGQYRIKEVTRRAKEFMSTKEGSSGDD